MADVLPPSFLELVPEHIKKVGVFVNESAETMIEQGKKFHLQVLQLHGNETPETCQQVKDAGFEVFKVFSVGDKFDFTSIDPYLGIADFFLFDTQTPAHGGSGKKFNWDVLHKYKGETPFFLSGGIGPGDTLPVRRFNHPKFAGIDLNSKFELEPGVKDVTELSMFLFHLKQE